MTAIALKSFDREPRTQTPKGPAPAKRDAFANFVEHAETANKQESLAAPSEDTAKHLLAAGPAQNEALFALLQNIPAAEMPEGGVPEAIATEVSVVVDLPDQPVTTTMTAAKMLDLLAQPPMPQLQGDMVPVAIDDEISDGIPVPIDVGPRHKPKKLVDEDAQTTAIPIPPAMRALMHAPTEIAMPAVSAESVEKTAIRPLNPNAVPVIPELVAKLSPVAPMPVAEMPLTPLEQSVQDLIGELADRNEDTVVSSIETPAFLPDVKLLSVEHADAPPPVAAVRDPKLPVENANPSHVHLVIDDGAERVVVTVAVRGNEVNVALRGQDDATTAALARNAGSLDHAMRARGLDLAGLMTQRDPDAQQRPAREQRERTQQPKEQFSIEELA